MDDDQNGSLKKHAGYNIPPKQLHLASRGLAVVPHRPHTTALSRDGERTGADDHLGERGTSLRANNISVSLYIYVYMV